MEAPFLRFISAFSQCHFRIRIYCIDESGFSNYCPSGIFANWLVLLTAELAPN
jgi:hypothetical protein